MALKRGRPKRSSFCGLFLPSIEWELGIEEMPMREFEDHATAGTFFRNARRAADDADRRKALGSLGAALRQMPPSSVRDDLVAAIAGDQAAEQRVTAARPWSMFIAGSGASPSLYLAEEFARIEALCEGADQALGHGDLRGAAQEVAKAPGAAVFWRHGSLDRLASASTLEQSLVPRLVAYLELQMSCMAMASVVEGRTTTGHGDPIRKLVAAGRRPAAGGQLHAASARDRWSAHAG